MLHSRVIYAGIVLLASFYDAVDAGPHDTATTTIGSPRIVFLKLLEVFGQIYRNLIVQILVLLIK